MIGSVIRGFVSFFMIVLIFSGYYIIIALTSMSFSSSFSSVSEGMAYTFSVICVVLYLFSAIGCWQNSQHKNDSYFAMIWFLPHCVGCAITYLAVSLAIFVPGLLFVMFMSGQSLIMNEDIILVFAFCAIFWWLILKLLDFSWRF